MCAARGIELRSPLDPASGTAAAIVALRQAGVAGAGPDRFLAPELELACDVVTRTLVPAVESRLGPLE